MEATEGQMVATEIEEGEIEIETETETETDRIEAVVDIETGKEAEDGTGIEKTTRGIERGQGNAIKKYKRTDFMREEMTTLGESCQFFNGKAHEKDIDAEVIDADG